MYKHKCTALTKFQVKNGAFIYRDKFHRELRKSILWQKLLEINTYKNIMELFFFKKPLHLRLLRHRKRTVTLYQNYGSSLSEKVGFEPTCPWRQTHFEWCKLWHSWLFLQSNISQTTELKTLIKSGFSALFFTPLWLGFCTLKKLFFLHK